MLGDRENKGRGSGPGQALCNATLAAILVFLGFSLLPVVVFFGLQSGEPSDGTESSQEVTQAYETIVVAKPDQFDTVLEQTVQKYRATQEPVFVLVAAKTDPATSRSWCPDTDRAMPHVSRTLSQVGGVLLLAEVEATAWRDAKYAYRQTNKPVLSLVEGECYDQRKLSRVVDQAHKLGLHSPKFKIGPIPPEHNQMRQEVQ